MSIGWVTVFQARSRIFQGDSCFSSGFQHLFPFLQSIFHVPACYIPCYSCTLYFFYFYFPFNKRARSYLFGKIGEGYRTADIANLSQDQRRRQYVLEDCHNIICKLSYEEQVLFYNDFEDHGLPNTTNKWRPIANAKKPRGVLIDPRFRY